MINAGDYRDVITIIKRSYPKDTDGFRTPSEETVLTAHAKIKQASGYTLFKQNADFKEAHINFTIRYSAVPKRGYYIIFNDEYYRIDYVRDIDNRHVETEMQAILVNMKG